MNIGEYRTVRLLGKGGMSEVYEVENARLGSRHALKLFTYEKDDPDVRERFQVEGKLLARLSHPRIVKVTDFGTDEASGRPYFAMDLILNDQGEMQLLSDVEPGTVDEETVGRWYDDLREGLAYIHANGVIHRDLKLQNVLIGPDGHAVLTDFGISKIFDVKGDGVKIVDTVRTLVKVKEGRSLVMGSIGYMAPELEMGVAASPQSDWYALGVIVYRLLTGTWCDARTDVVGTLETYDPVWKRIIPKLLHANPNGRECLSYADERRRDRERDELWWEERWLREKSRGHLARHVARYAAVAAMVFAVAIVGFVSWQKSGMSKMRAELLAAERQLLLPDFSDVCRLPHKVSLEKSGGLGGIDRTTPSLQDAWMLTHEVFEDLNAGKISIEKATETIQSLANKAQDDYQNLFALGSGYLPHGSQSVLVRMLQEAAREMTLRTQRLKEIEECSN